MPSKTEWDWSAGSRILADVAAIRTEEGQRNSDSA